MDPSACWKLILESIQDQDRTQAIDSIADLQNWLNRGGFLPDGFDNRANLEDLLQTLLDLTLQAGAAVDRLLSASEVCNTKDEAMLAMIREAIK